MYLYLWRTEISNGQVMLETDLLESIAYAVKHAQQFPDVTEQSIINRELKEVCSFRDTRFNGK